MAERERRVISLVGGGGKTTTMYALAEIFREEGKKVIVTTSTHLQTPPEEIRAWNIEEVRSLWKSDQIAVIGTDCENAKKSETDGQKIAEKSVRKMSIPEPVFLQEVLQEAEVVLIEADGAKHLPCKVPIEKEPVIIPECTDVIAVVGMDALGKPLEEVCFRKDLAVQFFNTSYKHLMAEEDRFSYVPRHICSTFSYLSNPTASPFSSVYSVTPVGKSDFTYSIWAFRSSWLS